MDPVKKRVRITESRLFCEYLKVENICLFKRELSYTQTTLKVGFRLRKSPTFKVVWVYSASGSKASRIPAKLNKEKITG